MYSMENRPGEELYSDKPRIVIVINIPDASGAGKVAGMAELQKPLTAGSIEETAENIVRYMTYLLIKNGVIPPIDNEPGQDR